MTDLLDAPLEYDTDRDPTPVEGDAAVPRRSWSWLPTLVSVLVVVGASVYTLAQLHPEALFRNTTPTGGDFGAHVWGPAYLRDHLLPHWRLSGWAPDWYAGFPMYHFYMVLPALLVVLVDVVLPYGVALKLVGILGIATLPIACWAFGKLAGLVRPIPELFAWAAVFFLFDETFQIYGGNIASTMAGEFSFSIALSLAVFYLAVFAYGMRTGRLRWLAALLLAATILCHVIVGIFAVVGTVLMFLLYLDRKRFAYAFSVGLVGSLLTAFWALPFWYRGPFMTDMFYERRTDFVHMLFPQSMPMNILINGIALIGLIGALVRVERPAMWLGLMTCFYGVWAVVWPQSHLWNARLLPFFYLTRYLLVAVGVVEIGRAVGRFVAPNNPTADRRARIGTLAVALPLALVMLGLHLQNLPFWSQAYNGASQRWEYSFDYWRTLGVESKPAYVDDWANWNFTGYQGRQAYGEYRGIVQTMQQIGESRGCGRATWENNNDTDKYGTPMALMLLPFWTDGCIGSMEGLYFESSGTTPFHFQAASAVSQHSSDPVRRLPYEDGQLDKGVDYLRQLGVRYYLAFTPQMVEKAKSTEGLTEIATSGPWHVYAVSDWSLVAPLDRVPVVVNGITTSPLKIKQARDGWLEVGMSWFQDRDVWDGNRPADGGPPSWPRVDTKVIPDPVTGAQQLTDDTHLAKVEPAAPIDAPKVDPVTVTDIVQTDDSISFKVDKVGVPVVVRTSYFPNWHVTGAEGPWRIAPNFMVVVPTSNEVRLHYGYTPVDILGMVLSLLGLVGVVALWRMGPVEYPQRPEPEPDDDDVPAWLRSAVVPAAAAEAAIPSEVAWGPPDAGVARAVAPPGPPGRPDLFLEWDDDAPTAGD